ncbi:MAG: hypothetical protein JWN04_1665 [Myxococcaceae bacterium]|nr:hypothetical protein [Myxococcaceae bacterium]
MRSSAPRSPHALSRSSWLCLVMCVVTACAPELDKLGQRRSTRGSFGEEVYKAVCRRMAGTEMPDDVAGRRSEAVCLGDTETVQQALAEAALAESGSDDAPGGPAVSDAGARSVSPVGAEPLTARMIALAERRAALAQAVDDTFSDELADELEHLFRGLLPFYDPPEERIERASRALAAVLGQLATSADPNVLGGLARVGRKGMLPREGSLGLTRGLLGAPHLRDMARSVLPLLTDEPAVSTHFETLTSGLALELATIEVNAPPDSDLQRLKRLLLLAQPDFGSGQPLYGSVRDARGLPTPNGVGTGVPFPFVDANGDGIADASGARLSTQASFRSSLPEPFPTLGEAPAVRDAFGRASAFTPAGPSDPSRPLYLTEDADTTLLAGLLHAGQKLFRDDTLTQALSVVSSSVVGDHVPTTKPYGALLFAYQAPNPAVSPLLDFAHGASALLDRAVSSASLALGKAMLESQEGSVARALAPLLTLERRTRAGSDAYPRAQLKPGHTFWDELLYQLEMMSRRRTSANSDTLLESLMRASLGLGRNLQKPAAPIEQLVDPELLKHQGVVIASLMRFKDEWRSNPKGESQRAPGEPAILGAFRTPVDRSQPDLPTTCGRDGCGGSIAGSLFERWAKDGQNCVIQRLGRPITAKDCGQPPNQSLLQRSLGLIYEMAGRSQCNKPITIGNLLDFAVLKDPCVGSVVPDSPACDLLRTQQSDERSRSVSSAETAVRSDYACPANAPASAPCKAFADKYPAAFVDPDGPGGAAASIQACHMLDLPDVGRTFGAAVLHEYRLQFPNPWVRRYLEDVARAGDHDGDGTADLPACDSTFQVLDPSLAPPCIPSAASLSRDIYKEMPGSVDTLGELVEFLLDDSELFTNDQDTAELRPDVKALSRVLFAPAGSTSFVIFDPLLLRGAPPACSAAPTLPACANDDTAVTPAGGCCIKNSNLPPLRYRLDTFYGSTSFAWEQEIMLHDGTALSFLDTMRPLSDAVARYDFDAKTDDPALFEDTSYLFSTLGKLIAEHYDSQANTAAQASDPSAINYRRLTGLSTYEAMVADALDDGSIEFGQTGPDGLALFAPDVSPAPGTQLGLLSNGLSLVQVLSQLRFDGGEDGLDIGAEVAEQMLSPHARCAGQLGDRRVIAGLGACDRQALGQPGFDPPFTYRSGQSNVCWNDGSCFDGKALPRRFASPVYVLLDALKAMETRAKSTPARNQALHDLLSGLLDAYATVSHGQFDDRRVRALLISLLDYTRSRVDEERAAGRLASYGARTDRAAADFLHNPVIAGSVGMFENLQGRGSALTDLSNFSASVLSETGAQNNLRPLLAGLFDLVQLLPGDAQSNAALRSLGSMFSTQVDGALAGDGSPLAPLDSALVRNLYMLRQTAALDTGELSVLEQVLQNLARVPPGRASPLEVILDAVLATNRVTPGDSLTPSGDDLRIALSTMAGVMLDERRGFERLYDIVRCSQSGATAGCE